MLDFQYKNNGLNISFKSTKVPSNTIFEWDFGDDSEVSNLKAPTHTYSEIGFYDVILKTTYTDGSSEEVQKTVVVSDIVKTHLTDSIYNLINEFIPQELSDPMTYTQKSIYINKWQLYIHPLVNRPVEKDIPEEEYNNELYYEGLENELIMELAAWDYLNIKILNILTGAGQYIYDLTTSNNSTSDDDDDSVRGDRVKRIQTGPTEVEYFDNLTESTSSLFKAYSQAIKPGGILDELRKNLCMLSKRVSIYLPFCDQPYHPIIPKVVNRRNPGILGGPNPKGILSKNGVTLIPKNSIK